MLFKFNFLFVLRSDSRVCAAYVQDRMPNALARNTASVGDNSSDTACSTTPTLPHNLIALLVIVGVVRRTRPVQMLRFSCAQQVPVLRMSFKAVALRSYTSERCAMEKCELDPTRRRWRQHFRQGLVASTAIRSYGACGLREGT